MKKTYMKNPRNNTTIRFNFKVFLILVFVVLSGPGIWNKEEKESSRAPRSHGKRHGERNEGQESEKSKKLIKNLTLSLSRHKLHRT